VGIRGRLLLVFALWLTVTPWLALGALAALEGGGLARSDLLLVGVSILAMTPLGFILWFVLGAEFVRPVEYLTAAMRRSAEGKPPDTRVLRYGNRRDQLGQLVRGWLRIEGKLAELNQEREMTTQVLGEFLVARRIQTSMLPRALSAENLEVAARTVAAEEVGGDYYDVLPTEDGAWIGIGDVAGHGLHAGMIMLTVQSAVSALTKAHPAATPKEILGLLNEVIYENIHHRLEVQEYVTLSLIRFYKDGRMLVAGAHEDIVVYRARERRCEILPTEGTWVGVINDIREFTTDASHTLEDGDLMVLFTDGVTEAPDDGGAPFGFERLSETVAAVGDRSVHEIVDHVVEQVTTWAPRRPDDLSVMALRFRKATRMRKFTSSIMQAIQPHE
jgi:sigma-B regulation protein RsbU (phosphoserine phosphatase)